MVLAHRERNGTEWVQKQNPYIGSTDFPQRCKGKIQMEKNNLKQIMPEQMDIHT